MEENLIHLLVIEQSRNDAEAYNSMLRPAGYAVRLHYVGEAGDLPDELQEKEVDLLLYSPTVKGLTTASVVNAVKESGKDIPVLVIVDPFEPARVLDALRSGARDAIPKGQADHIRLVIARELKELRDRRELDAEKTRARDCERRSRALLDSSRDAIAYVADGMHVYANGAYLSLFGFESFDDIEGMPILDMVAGEDHAKFKEMLRNHPKLAEAERNLEARGRKPDDSTFSARMEFSAATLEGEPCTQIIIRDQSLSQELEKKIQYLSNQDLLTGLYNRQYFIEELEVTVSRAAKQVTVCSLLYIEIDEFQAIKEQVGIAASDIVLGDIANILKQVVTEDDILARFGDRSFAVLTCDRSQEDVLQIAERIRAGVEGHICEVNGRSVATTCSIGVCAIGDNAKNAQEILSRADVTCAQARTEGGNRVRVHNPVTQKQATENRDQQWVAAIQEALKQNRLLLMYQPIVSMHGSAERIYEVLLRMQSPTGEQILPGEFLPIAERHGLAKFIDQWVIVRALRMLVDQKNAGNGTRFFLHVSEQVLTDPSLLKWLGDQLRAAQIPGSQLVFEVSESLAATHIREAVGFAKGLQSLHSRLCLTGFTGSQTSTSLLRHITPQFVKVEHGLMHQLANNAEHQKTLREICDQMKERGIQTVASFVEDASSLAVLYSLNVDFIQGYFLQIPTDSLSFDFQGEAL